MILNNKKGDMILDSLLILLLLILFFTIVDPLQVVVNEVTVYSNDNIVIWMLRAFPFFILVGIIKYVFDSGKVGI